MYLDSKKGVYCTTMLPQFESPFLNGIKEPLRNVYGKDIFPRMIEHFSKAMEKTAREQFIEYVTKMDEDFRYSKGRSDNYYVKDTRNRTIITILGEITYKRTIYVDRHTGKSFAYVDEKLNIDRYIRYTDDVGAYVYEASADENSMIKVGKEVGNLIYSKFSLTKDSDHAIPRQTIYNLLKRSGNIMVNAPLEKRTIKDIYLLFDEKYVGSKNDKDIMIKSCLITEGLNKGKRHSYIEPKYISSSENDLIERVCEYLENKYDTKHIEHFHILSDGGNWIDGLYRNLPYDRSKKIKYLDRFHAFQSMWRASMDEEIYKTLLRHLFKNERKQFVTVLEALKDTFPNRKETIIKETKYLLRNYKEIRNMINLTNMNCAMEQVISHHLASHFASVPKAYSEENIKRYISQRDNYRNGENLKLLYINRTGKTTIINKMMIDYSSLPSYSIELPGKKHSSWKEDNPSLNLKN